MSLKKRELVIPLIDAITEMGGLNQIESNDTIDVEVTEGVTKLTVKEGQLPSDVITLPSNTNLNTVMEPGIYIPTGAFTKSNNYPMDGMVGRLIVLDGPLGNSAIGRQQIYITLYGEIWIRAGHTPTLWVGWFQVAVPPDAGFFGIKTSVNPNMRTMVLADGLIPKTSLTIPNGSINGYFEPGFYHQPNFNYATLANGYPKTRVPGMLMVTSGGAGGSLSGRCQVFFGYLGESFIRHAHGSNGYGKWLPLGISNNYYGYKAPADILPNVLWTNTSRTYTTVKVLATSSSPFSIEGEYLLKAGETPLVVSKATSIPNTSGEHSATIEVTVAPSQQFRWRATEGTGELTGKIITHEFLPLS